MAESPGAQPQAEPPAFSAVVPAAGLGARMRAQSRKPLLPLDGVPILFHTLWRLSLATGCNEIVIAVNRDDLDYYRDRWWGEMRSRFGVSAVVPGGAVRQASVLAALEATDTSAKLVLIHDAVRPLVRVELIEEVAARVAECGAAIAAVPAVATVKEVDPQGIIRDTPPRDRLWMAHTPQGFRRELALQAHRKAREDGFVGTDDALLVERMGLPVAVVEDRPDNIKITTAQDLAVAEAILRLQREEGLRGADLSGSE